MNKTYYKNHNILKYFQNPAQLSVYHIILKLHITRRILSLCDNFYFLKYCNVIKLNYSK